MIKEPQSAETRPRPRRPPSGISVYDRPAGRNIFDMIIALQESSEVLMEACWRLYVVFYVVEN